MCWLGQEYCVSGTFPIQDLLAMLRRGGRLDHPAPQVPLFQPPSMPSQCEGTDVSSNDTPAEDVTEDGHWPSSGQQICSASSSNRAAEAPPSRVVTLGAATVAQNSGLSVPHEEISCRPLTLASMPTIPIDKYSVDGGEIGGEDGGDVGQFGFTRGLWRHHFQRLQLGRFALPRELVFRRQGSTSRGLLVDRVIGELIEYINCLLVDSDLFRLYLGDEDLRSSQP